MKLRHFILISIGGMFLSACAPIVPLGVVSPPDIIVTIQNGSATIITTGNPKCKPQNQGPGCLKIGKGSTGLINFMLNAPPFWSFDSFEICKGTTDINKVCDLNVWERMEFIVTGDSGVTALIPDNVGLVNLKLLSADLDSFILFDQNRLTQDYYYRVKVCNSNTTVCSWADPPLENEGIK